MKPILNLIPTGELTKKLSGRETVLEGLVISLDFKFKSEENEARTKTFFLIFFSRLSPVNAFSRINSIVKGLQKFVAVIGAFVSHWLVLKWLEFKVKVLVSKCPFIDEEIDKTIAVKMYLNEFIKKR